MESTAKLLIDGLVAAGTIGAVIVALYGRKFYPPRLRIELVSCDGELTSVPIGTPDPDTGELLNARIEAARYYRLRVRNKRRWSPATGTRLFLLQVDQQDAAGNFTPVWASDVPIVWKHTAFLGPARTVGPDAEADLFTIVRGKWLELKLLANPNNLQTRFRDGIKLELLVQAKSTERDSPLARVQVVWDGKWTDGAEEMRSHVVFDVREERPQSSLSRAR